MFDNLKCHRSFRNIFKKFVHPALSWNCRTCMFIITVSLFQSLSFEPSILFTSFIVHETIKSESETMNKQGNLSPRMADY